MYLRKLSVNNVKLLREADLSFEPPRDDAPSWTVLLGDNGSCKTTLLQAIALAAAGSKLSEKLADARPYPDQRLPEEPAVVEASFAFSDRRHGARDYPGLDEPPGKPPMLRSTVAVPPGWSGFQAGSSYGPAELTRLPTLEPDPLTEARALNLKDWFIVGYGSSRALPAPHSARLPDNPAFSRLESLFHPVNPIGTGFVDIFAQMSEVRTRAYVKALKGALVVSGLLPDVDDLELRGQGGVRSAADLQQAHRFSQRVGGELLKLPATWLSQGYQSTIAWVADLIGHIHLEAATAEVPTQEMEGIALIDELDLHLHPTWQTTLISVLKRIFPRIQFIATTHSPMLLPALRQQELFLLRRDESGSVTIKPALESPALMTGTEIYSAFFGIDRLYPADLGEQLRRYAFLVGSPARTDEEEDEMRQVREALRAGGVEPGWEPVPRAHLADDSANDRDLQR